MTARLSVVRSIPVLTAVVTVVSDSPASSIPFYNQHQRFFELVPSTFNLGCLLRSSAVAFVGTEVAVRDLVGLQSTAELCQPLARRCS